jgi:hypothetical protein
MSAKVAFPIQRLLPLRIYPPYVFLAVVFRLVASLPFSASVSPKDKIFFKAMPSGRIRALYSSLPR